MSMHGVLPKQPEIDPTHKRTHDDAFVEAQQDDEDRDNDALENANGRLTVEDFERCSNNLKQDPSADNNYQLALCYIRGFGSTESNYKKALMYLQEALRKDEKHAGVWFEFAKTITILNRNTNYYNPKAITFSFINAIVLNPNLTEAWQVLARRLGIKLDSSVTVYSHADNIRTCKYNAKNAGSRQVLRELTPKPVLTSYKQISEMNDGAHTHRLSKLREWKIEKKSTNNDNNNNNNSNYRENGEDVNNNVSNNNLSNNNPNSASHFSSFPAHIINPVVLVEEGMFDRLLVASQNLEALKIELGQLTTDIAQKDEQLVVFTNKGKELAQLKQENSTLGMRIAECSSQRQQCVTEIDALHAKLDDKTQAVAKLREEIQTKTAELKQLKTIFAQEERDATLKNQKAIADLKAEIEAKERQIEPMNRQLLEKSRQIEMVRDMLQSAANHSNTDQKSKGSFYSK